MSKANDLIVMLGGEKVNRCKAANITDLYHGGLQNLSHHGMGAPAIVGDHVGESVGNLLRSMGAGASNAGRAVGQYTTGLGRDTANVMGSVAGSMGRNPGVTGAGVLGLAGLNAARGMHALKGVTEEQQAKAAAPQQAAIKAACDMYKISAPMVPGLMGKVMSGAKSVMSSPMVQNAGNWARRNPSLAGAGIGAVGGAVAGGEGNRMQGAASGAILGRLGGQIHASGAFGQR